MNYSNIVSHLFKRVPDFNSIYGNQNTDLPYVVFGSLALYLCKLIHDGDKEILLGRSFKFLNEMALSEDRDVINLLVTGVLEVIADDNLCKRKAINYMSDECQRRLNEI